MRFTAAVGLLLLLLFLLFCCSFFFLFFFFLVFARFYFTSTRTRARKNSLKLDDWCATLRFPSIDWFKVHICIFLSVRINLLHNFSSTIYIRAPIHLFYLRDCLDSSIDSCVVVQGNHQNWTWVEKKYTYTLLLFLFIFICARRFLFFDFIVLFCFVSVKLLALTNTSLHTLPAVDWECAREMVRFNGIFRWNVRFVSSHSQY